MVPFSSFVRCSDPIVLCTGAGHAAWCNDAARRMFRLEGEGLPVLSTVIPKDQLEQLLATPHFTAASVAVQAGQSTVQQTVLAVSIGSGEPGEDLFLLLFKSCPIPWQQRTPREEALAMLTHDLKNPLGAVFGYADALLDTPLGEELTPGQRQVLHKIRATSSRSIELVRNWELLFKLGSSTVRRTSPALDLNQIVTQVVEYSWRDDNNSPKIALSLYAAPLPVSADRSQLDRIVSNLFTNAVKYTPPHGSIQLLTRQETSQAVFLIHNTAEIPAGELPTLFEKYSRVSTSKGRPGAGLGLYITKMLVDMLGGSITVESGSGHGTTFTVKLPLSSAQP